MKYTLEKRGDRWRVTCPDKTFFDGPRLGEAMVFMQRHIGANDITAPPDRIDPGAQVRLISDGDDDWIGAYGHFSAENSLELDEEEAIARAIRETGEYRGGGGASPVWTLKLAPDPTADAALSTRTLLHAQERAKTDPDFAAKLAL